MSFVGVYFVVAGSGTVEMVVKATKTEPTPVTVTTNIFPCKLIALRRIHHSAAYKHL